MKKIKQVVLWCWKFSRKVSKDRVDAYAAQSAFFIIMGFIPFLMMLLAMLQYTPLTPNQVMDMIMDVLPESFREFLQGIIAELFTKSTAILSGTAIAAVWAAGRAVLAMTKGLNSVFHIDETRNYFYMRIRSAFYIIFFIIALILAMVLLVFGNKIQEVLLSNIPFLQQFSGFIISVRTVVTLVILAMLFLGMYVLLPNRHHVQISSQLPGAIVTAFTWSIFSYGFSIYFEMVGQMSRIYGSLTTVIMIMLWLYFCMWLLFIGAEINAYLEDPYSFFTELEENIRD